MNCRADIANRCRRSLVSAKRINGGGAVRENGTSAEKTCASALAAQQLHCPPPVSAVILLTVAMINLT